MANERRQVKQKVVPGSPEHRARIIANIRRWCVEQREFLDDLDYWNRTHPDEEPIDCPDVREMLNSAEQMLASDPGHGPIAPFQWLIARESKTVQ